MTTTTEIDAKKERFGEAEAIDVLAGMTKLFVAKGKKVTSVDLKNDRPDGATLTSLLLGPTGNLRAPTLKTGKTILVGFNEEMYGDVFA